MRWNRSFLVSHLHPLFKEKGGGRMAFASGGTIGERLTGGGEKYNDCYQPSSTAVGHPFSTPNADLHRWPPLSPSLLLYHTEFEMLNRRVIRCLSSLFCEEHWQGPALGISLSLSGFQVFFPSLDLTSAPIKACVGLNPSRVRVNMGVSSNSTGIQNMDLIRLEPSCIC